MRPDWAEENLHTIRTLMERTALYRRTLAPIMIYVGVVGLLSAAIAELGIFPGRKPIRDPEDVALFWLCVGAVAFMGAFGLARRQALGEAEPFWSPPTRRVAQSLAPLLLAGFVLGVVAIFCPMDDENMLSRSQPRHGAIWLIALWLMLYGGALNAAGFFMKRGIKLFGWCYLLGGISLIIGLNVLMDRLPAQEVGRLDIYANWLMGLFFGGGHLAYGVYLYFTEEQPEAAMDLEEDATPEEPDEA